VVLYLHYLQKDYSKLEGELRVPLVAHRESHVPYAVNASSESGPPEWDELGNPGFDD
jgi:hypothetical protein